MAEKPSVKEMVDRPLKKVVGAATAAEPNIELHQKTREPSEYEIKDSDTFKVKFGLAQVGEDDEKRWIVTEDRVDPEIKRHWVRFRMWKFGEELHMKQIATVYDPVKKIHYLDQDSLNALKIRHLLSDWSFSEKNDSMKLFHVNGVLADESYAMFMGLYPSICRHIIYEMNSVIEGEA